MHVTLNVNCELISLFVRGTLLAISGYSICERITEITANLERVNKYLFVNKLILNISKTGCVIVILEHKQRSQY